MYFFGLRILKLISDNPCINVPRIYKLVNDENVSLDMVSKRKLSSYIEYKGAYKNGGYYLK